MPGCFNKPTHWHHILVTRHPDHESLYHDYNMGWACHEHHAPSAAGLDYWCIKQKFEEEGITPQAIELWVEELPFKVTPTLPEVYYEVRWEVFGY